MTIVLISSEPGSQSLESVVMFSKFQAHREV